MVIIFLLLAGFLCGILSKLYGLGGGLTVNPVLLYILPLVGIPDHDVYEVTLSTTLTIMFVNSVINGYRCLNKSSIEKDVIINPLFYILFGCCIGCVCMITINKNIGIIFFTIFVTIINISEYVAYSFFTNINILAIRGFICGVISSWIGGGSSLMMYSYVQKHKKILSKEASGICNVYNIVISVFCILMYYLFSEKVHITGVFLNIYINAVFYILLGSLSGSFFASWLENKKISLYRNILYKIVLMIINVLVVIKLVTIY